MDQTQQYMAATTQKSARGQWIHWRDRLIPYLLLVPAIVLILAVIMYPIGYSAYLSLTDANLLKFDQKEFVETENYERLFSRDDLRTSVWRTGQYTVGTVVLSFSLGLFVALMLNERFRFRGIARTLLIIPWATPWLVVTLIWFVMFNPRIGPVNQILEGLGIIQTGKSWLYQRDTAMPSIVITTSWRLFPAVSLIILASLQSIPPSLYEAAKVDGASRLQRFRHITLPSIRAAIFTVVTLLTIWSSKLFTIAWALTQGGPGDATQVLSVYTYQQAFASNRLGRGSAIAMISFAITLVLVVFYFLLTRPQAQEEA